MAASNTTIKTTGALTGIVPEAKTWMAVYADLFKARLTFLVLLTTLVGFYAGSRSPVDYALMFHAIFGTLLIASGAAALNEYIERDYDALMRRTRNRPLPSGRLTPGTVLWVGCSLGVGGIGYLFLFTGFMVAALGAASLIIYVLIYTPLKRVTWLNTLVGSVPGGLPPLMGWAAARGELTLEALPLFGILACWQIPHFLAIAWMYREEYEKAGFKMLPSVDPTGKRTGRQAFGSAALLLGVSICPFLFGSAGAAYLAGAVVLGSAFAWFAVQFNRSLSVSSARQLFFASILYLPLVLAVLVLDKN